MITTKRGVLAAAAALALPLLVPGPAWAADRATTTYHGTFTAVNHGVCVPAVTEEPTVTGTWNAAVHGSSSVTLTFDIFVDGAHHVSFGGPFAQKSMTGATFAADIPIGDMTLTVSLVGDQLTYRLVPYDVFGYVCDQVTYSGELGR